MMLPDFRGLELYRLPDVKGSYKKHVVMAPYTWFRVGGATTVFRPQDHEDLSQFLLQNSEEVPVTIIGACLLYTSPSPRDKRQSRMPSSA